MPHNRCYRDLYWLLFQAIMRSLFLRLRICFVSRQKLFKQSFIFIRTYNTFAVNDKRSQALVRMLRNVSNYD